MRLSDALINRRRLISLVTAAGKHHDTPSDPDGAKEISPLGPLRIIEPAKVQRNVQRTSYRKRGTSDEEWREKRKHEREEEEAQLRALAKLNLKEAMRPRTPPIMLIDAYNIIHMDPDLQALMQSGGDQLTFARAELEKRVQIYARVSGVQCQIVYDAIGLRGSSRRSTCMNQLLDERVSTIFSTTEEADSYIVKEAHNLKAGGRDRVEIVSNDRRIKMETSDLTDFVIYTVNANKFVQDLKECARGNTRVVPSRGVSNLPDNAECLEQQRLANAALAEKQQAMRLPEVVAPSLEQKLLREFERITYESSSDEDDQTVTADPQLGPESLDKTGEVNQNDLVTDLSSDLNALFNTTKNDGVSQSRWKRKGRQ